MYSYSIISLFFVVASSFLHQLYGCEQTCFPWVCVGLYLIQAPHSGDFHSFKNTTLTSWSADLPPSNYFLWMCDIVCSSWTCSHCSSTSCVSTSIAAKKNPWSYSPLNLALCFCSALSLECLSSVSSQHTWRPRCVKCEGVCVSAPCMPAHFLLLRNASPLCHWNNRGERFCFPTCSFIS